MNAFEQLQSLGLVLPTPTYIVGAILFGLVGWLSFRRGRKSQHSQLTWVGLALMFYPYAVAQTWLLWLLGTALSVWVYFCWE
ncbi:hypothetical protein HC248_01582 [Polaromonas vacuolata]|uniref:Uncharacterized protein n=1 Tax=Polaromonas vacuolata TaxID=37448 RepID=A0A6H2H8X6_9BURK|nr:hypothetical protein [Polaromonas vacuolata]QJC56280.1 hypothetical protein HC248_01582 [Polaromonas vacuolata]